MRFYDNTMLSAYRRCPRYFYFRHRMHWLPDGAPRPPLVFGGAWHAAMDAVWLSLTDGESRDHAVDAGYAAFVAHWIAEGLPPPSDIDYEMEKAMAPRTPGNALDMIAAYVETRHRAITQDFQLQACEQPFLVPLDRRQPDLAYIGKIDKVVLRDGRVGGIEHKTTTSYKAGNGSSKFRAGFLESFSPNSQVDGYLYALHLMFPDQVFGVWVDAALVHRTEQSFTFIPVERQLRQLDLWLWEARAWIQRLEADVEAASEASPNDPYLPAFPKNTQSCFDFNATCPYLTLCKSWTNPIGKEQPLGYRTEIWNPLDHIDQTKLPRNADA